MGGRNTEEQQQSKNNAGGAIVRTRSGHWRSPAQRRDLVIPIQTETCGRGHFCAASIVSFGRQDAVAADEATDLNPERNEMR